jgi:hypothetical protein
MRDSNAWRIVFCKHPPLNSQGVSDRYSGVAVGRWLGEARASLWFYDTWTGERGNYTNATAGYVGHNLSSGIESHVRYMTRYSWLPGSTQRISLKVFVLSLIQYISLRRKNMLTRFYARLLVHISFHLKQRTSHPRFGKRFKNSKLFVTSFCTVSLAERP